MSKDRLDEFTVEDLLEEVARRRAVAHDGSLHDFELVTEDAHHEQSRRELEGFLRNEAENEDDSSKPCPRCGRSCRVRAKSRGRKLRAVCGEVSFARNYHYCGECGEGFYPLDRKLDLPTSGDLTREMERRVLDFGVADTFEEGAERWSVHYNAPISPNLIRRVVDRQGQLLDEADSERVQEFVLPARTTAPELLMVYVDGSMVSTDEGWREVKVGVIVRGDQYLPGNEERRGVVTEARYVAHLGGVEEFRDRLDVALAAAGADDAERIVWLGDGAPWIWNLADEICPKAEQLLDWRHLQEVSAECAKTVVGAETDLSVLWADHVAELLWHAPMDPDGAAESIRTPESPPEHVAELLLELDEGWSQSESPSHREALEAFSRYVDRHRDRMNYYAFRERGDPTGSGTGESAHKHVIQARMKRAGQHWGASRADRMAQLRAVHRTTGPRRFFSVIQQAAAGPMPRSS